MYLRDFEGVELKELREILNELFNKEKIKVREGIHGKLIFLNQKSYEI